MKKAIIFVISLLLVSVAGVASAHAATLAVLVVGLETNEASNLFAMGLSHDATQAGYTVKTNAAVTAKLDELRAKHANNETVDTVGLAAWGATNGLDFVQLVVEKKCYITVGTLLPRGREQIIQVVRCGTEKYSGREYYRTQLVSQEAMEQAKLEEMVLIPGDLFAMYEPGYYVQLDTFHIGKYEVTQAQWREVMGSLPSEITGDFLGDSKPVVWVSWDEITDTINGFLKRLNAQTGRNYRLPTEAEWAYAAYGCKAGSCDSYTYSGSNTLGSVAWYKNNSDGTVHAVGQMLPNGLGLYDMTGNAREMCYDYEGADFTNNPLSSPALNPKGPDSGSTHVLRGGEYSSFTANCRLSLRAGVVPSNRYDWLGFRLV